MQQLCNPMYLSISKPPKNLYRAPVTPARGAVAYCVCGRRKIPPFGNFEPKKFGLRRGCTVWRFIIGFVVRCASTA